VTSIITSNRVPILVQGVLALAVCLVVTIIFVVGERVYLELQVVDRYNQPVNEVKIQITALEKKPVNKYTNNEGVAIFDAKMFRGHKNIYLTVTKAGYSSTSERITLDKDIQWQTYQIKLGVSSTPVRLVIRPSEASYRVSRQSTGEIITTGHAQTVTVIQFETDECYDVEAWLDDSGITSDTTFCVGDSIFDFIYDVRTLNMCNLSLDILPPNTQCVLKRRDDDAEIDSWTGSFSGTVPRGYYYLLAYTPTGIERIQIDCINSQVEFNYSFLQEPSRLIVTTNPLRRNITLVLRDINGNELIQQGGSFTKSVPRGNYTLDVIYPNGVSDRRNVQVYLDEVREIVPINIFVALTINIRPSSGRWELKQDPARVVASGVGDQTINNLAIGRYTLTGWLGPAPQAGHTKVFTLTDADTTVVLDVQKKKEDGEITISVDPGNVQWNIINLGNESQYQSGTGSTTIQAIPHGSYRIDFTYEGVSKQSDIIVLTQVNYVEEAKITFSGLDDKVRRCLSQDDYECAVKKYSECKEVDCKIPCNAYTMIGDAYLAFAFPDSGLQVFTDGYRDAECNLMNNKSFLYNYATNLYKHGTINELADSVYTNLRTLAEVEADPTLERKALVMLYVNAYRLLSDRITTPNSQWDVPYMCGLVVRCEGDTDRIHTLNNILDGEFQDISTLKSAIEGFKIKLQCITPL